MANFQCLITVLLITIASTLSFDVSRKDNVVVYWGQNDNEKSLASYCGDSTYDVIILSFVNVFFDSSSKVGSVNLPLLSINYDYCHTYFSNFPKILSCPSIAADIKTCQSKGKAIMISLGGADGTYGFTSSSQATQFATTMWNMFGGGKDSSYPRPFGTAIIDGMDLDIEQGSAKYYNNFVIQLRSLMDADTSKKYYISGAPQCPYPDEWVGPGTGTALDAVRWDFLNIQFYNNYCGVNKGSNFNYNTWANWAKTSTYNKNIRLLIGAPSSADAAGDGYVSIDTMVNYVNTYKSNANFGGAMFWDAGNADKNIVCGTQNYIQCLSVRMKGSSSTTSTSTTKSATSSTTKAATSSTSTTKAATSSTTKASSTTKSILPDKGTGSTTGIKKSGTPVCSLGDGFYCSSSSQYVWCVGSSHWIMGCGAGTICNTKSVTQNNPCGHPIVGESVPTPTGDASTGGDDTGYFFDNPFSSNSTDEIAADTSADGGNINNNNMQSSEQESKAMSNKKVAIIAGTLGAGIGMLATIVVVILFLRHRRHRERDEPVAEIGTAVN